MQYSAEHAGDVFCRVFRQPERNGISGSGLSVFNWCFLLTAFLLSLGCMVCVWLTWRFFTGRKRNIGCGIAAGVCFLAGAMVCSGALKMPILPDEHGKQWGPEQLDGEQIEGSGIVEQISEKEGTVTLLLKNVQLFSPCQGQLGKSVNLAYEPDTENSGSCQNGEEAGSFESGRFRSEECSFRPGQEIRFTGTFSRYSAASNPGAFDYRDYCWSLGIAGQVETKENQIQARGGGSFFRCCLWRFRNFVKQRILQMAQQEDAGILICLVTGDKTELNSYWKELYQEGGIIHLLTISGLHISILGMGAFRLLRKLMGSFFLSSLLSGILTGSFCVMAGPGTSMVRAMICFMLFLLAGCVGKTYDFLTAVSVSGLLILFEHPLLLFQSGFLMTFSCVLGIGILLPLGELIFIEEQENGKYGKTGTAFQKTLLSAVLLQLSSLPAVLWFQGTVPLAGPLINLITVPFMSFVLISDMLAVAGSLAAVPLGIFLLGAAHYILRWYEQVCLFFGSMPFSKLVAGRPRWWQIILWFAILAFVLAAGYCHVTGQPVLYRCFSVQQYQNILYQKMPEHWKMPEHRKLPFVMGLLLLPCAIFVLQRFPDTQLVISFLDVGQGDGIVIKMPYGEGVFCIDGGSSSQKKLSEYVYEPYFLYEGIDYVDCWLLTHPDSDHYSGMIALLEEGFPVGKIMIPAVFRDSELAGRIEALHPVDYIQAGDCVTAGEIQFEILHPRADYSILDENDASAVVYLEWKNFSALFTGDMALESEDEVISALNGRTVDVLKAAHHGSKTATSEVFLKALSVQAAVLSCGKNNRYGHPHKEVMERLEQEGIDCRKTSEAGCIRVFSDGENYKINNTI